MDYINKSSIKNLFYIVISALLIVVLFSSLFFIGYVAIFLALVYGAYKGIKALWIKGQQWYYSRRINRNFRSFKWDIVEDESIKEVFKKETIIVDVDFEEIK